MLGNRRRTGPSRVARRSRRVPTADDRGRCLLDGTEASEMDGRRWSVRVMSLHGITAVERTTHDFVNCGLFDKRQEQLSIFSTWGGVN